MRRPVIAGNWKLFKTIQEATTFAQEFGPMVANAQKVDIILAPVFTALAKVAESVHGTSVKIAAQDCHWEEEGAFTGEVSPKLLLDAGCSHVIIGHSERRQYFGETDDSVNKKLKASLQAGIIPIVCVGETLEQRESGAAFTVIETQVRGALKDISLQAITPLIIAYEPVWAIGTGKTATDLQAQEIHAVIRSLIEQLYDTTTAATLRILYGGSVKPDNITELMAQPDIDGALVGGASLKADSFSAIVNRAAGLNA